MRHIILLAQLLLIVLLLISKSFAQTGNEGEVIKPDTVIITETNIKVQEDILSVEKDSVPRIVIELTPKFASHYINNLLKQDDLWRDQKSEFKNALIRLSNNYFEPFDSVKNRLTRFPFESIEIKSASIVHKDTIPIRWLNRPYFIVDTVTLDKDPIIKQKTIVMRVIDPLSAPIVAKMPDMKDRVESMLQATDTILETIIDYKYLESKKIKIHKVTDDGITPSIAPRGRSYSTKFIADSSKIVITKISRAFVANKESPFYIVPNEKMPDSLHIAINTLLEYTNKRDSIFLQIKDSRGRRRPVWLTDGREGLFRYWVKNSKNDSVTVWIGNPSKSELSIILDEDVNVEQVEKRMIDDFPFTTLKPDRTLVKVTPLKEIPIFWNYGLLSSYALNGNYLSNWARGGESSVSSMLDISGKADYNNKEAKMKWTNSGRLRYGTTWTEKYKEFRSNVDILEFNSQFNNVIREKLDFSSVFYMRTQVARGYSYPANAEPIVVSKFLNPGSFTIGAGFEYKPNKKTGINFSVLSYRNTFVLDTALINQKAYGIEGDKRTRHEMGGQLVVRNSTTIFKDMEITNSVRLFSNYLKSPKNVDVDWEMGLEKHISWYFKIRLRLHLIYDDDILFPVKLPDGNEIKVPKTQFNPFLGLTLAFKI
jgi:hypothetical protein